MAAKRTENYQQQGWSLDDLFPAIKSSAVEKALAELTDRINDFAGYQAQLDDKISGKEFQIILDAFENIIHRLNKLSGFARLSFSADTQDQEAQNFLARINQFRAENYNRILFFELWWKGLPEDVVNRLLPGSSDYRYWLTSLRLEVPYTLSEVEEKLINLKNVNGRAALGQLYDSITNRYVFELEIDGQVRALTREELTSHFYARDPLLREAAYREMNRKFADDAPILGQIYQALVRDWHSDNLNLRGYQAAISPRNLSNDIPDEVVDTLISVVQSNKSVIQRFFKLKTQWLGMDTLHRYDIYAPVSTNTPEYTFGEAASLVLDSFAAFDPAVANLAERVFTANHLDSEIRPGKRSGAFCSAPSPKLTPWILQTFQGKLKNVTTMAHEMGHAIHDMLAAHHNSLTYHPSLPLAETASNFAELLLVDQLLARDPSQETRQALMFDQVEKGFKSILRQSYFAIFEQDAHQAIQQGASIDDLCALYLDNLKEQFGDAVQVSDDFQYEWLSIPHIYRYPFYVYAYAFGHLLVLALYEQYKQEGEPFKPRYKRILAAGGSEAPMTILENAGIDIHSAAFWQGGFDVLQQQLAGLENIPIYIGA